MENNDFCRTVNWYPVLGEHSELTGFLKLSEEEIKLLADGVSDGAEVAGVVERLKKLMRGGTFDNYFVSTDYCSPTDTERFIGKRGAVHSAESAWYFLAVSHKVRTAAQQGMVEYLAVRPFVKIDRTREFRLFIHDGELRAMSQYNLVRHFRRLEGIKEELWLRTKSWFEQIKWQLPVKSLTMDIYLEDDDQNIKIIDLNPWGEPTDPLLMRTFDLDWSCEYGIKLMLPPTKISGDVAVSF
ncbi:MAG: hypothetical protein E7052_06710 [Lentisphaerae bacterium]|nr:hypothetical protein [Lentisphaerota bacterium]